MSGRKLDISSTANLAAHFRDMRADYTAAKPGRFKRRIVGVDPMGSHADYHVRSDSQYMKLLEHARDHGRNDMVVGQAVDRACSLILRDGPKVEPATGSEALDRVLLERFEDWANDRDACDLAGEHTLMDLAFLGLKAVVIDGDHFFLPTRSGHLEAVEAHRVRTPSNTKRNVVLGVLRDKYRRALSYWVTREDVALNRRVAKVGDVVQIPAKDQAGHRQVFQMVNPERTSQTRGVTALAPIFDAVGMHNDIQFAKLVQQQIVSCFAIFREKPVQGTSTPPSATGAVTTETLSDGSVRTLQGVAPGMDVTGAAGEKLSGFSPNVPNPTFFEHVKLVLGIIAVNLKIPLQVLLLDPSDSNFSALRSALEFAKPAQARMLRQVVIGRFLRPVYEWKVRQWLATDEEIRALAESEGVVDALRHRWHPPRTPYLQPLHDAQADSLIEEKGLDSRRNILAGRGLDIEVIDAQRVTDNKNLIRRALEAAREIKQEFGEWSGDWRDVISPNPRTQEQAAPAGKQEAPAGNTGG